VSQGGGEADAGESSAPLQRSGSQDGGRRLVTVHEVGN
jgi:hypothetical protein